MDFSVRHREDELMDDSRLSIEILNQTFEDIARANRLLGGDKDILNAITEIVLEMPKAHFSIIDVGCGNGDLLRKVCQVFRQKGLKVQLLGIDLNEKAIALARKASTGYPEIQYKAVDVLQGIANGPKADLVISTLTMHHIAEENIPVFLKRLADMADSQVIINDLQRSRWAYYLFKGFSAIFIKTKIAKNDGLVSIRSSFTKKELLHYSKRFPELDHVIRKKWAFRLVWTMRIKRPIQDE